MGNYLSVVVGGIPSDSLLLTTDNGNIEREQNGWMIYPKKVGNASISVYKTVNADTVFILKKYFKVITFVEYVHVSILTMEHNDTASKSKLLAAKTIDARVYDLDIDLALRIEKYRVIILRGDSLIFCREMIGNKVSEEFKKYIKQTKTNDTIYFVDIIARDPSGTYIQLNELKLFIKE